MSRKKNYLCKSYPSKKQNTSQEFLEFVLKHLIRYRMSRKKIYLWKLLVTTHKQPKHVNISHELYIEKKRHWDMLQNDNLQIDISTF